MPVCIGVDIGSLTTKIVLITTDGVLLAQSAARSGYSAKSVAERMTAELLTGQGLGTDDVKTTVATGYGRITYPADREVSEITCQGKGIAYLYPNARTIIDIGGQDSKVIRILPNGRVADFAMNDKCAAGTGRFLEVMADTMEVPIHQTGEIALKADHPCKISSFCTVFAESEVISHLSQGAGKENILAGVCEAVASRVGGMTSKTGLEDDIVFTGGVALNSGVAKALKHVLGREIIIPDAPQITAALGAALIAKDL